MTRKEEIRQAAESFDIKIISNPWTLFEKGAEWADAHPKPITYEAIEDVAKEVIDVDWQKLQDRLWNMIERNLRAQFIRKACKWLNENFRVSSFDATKIVTHFSNMYDLEDDFCKAMKE